MEGSYTFNLDSNNSSSINHNLHISRQSISYNSKESINDYFKQSSHYYTIKIAVMRTKNNSEEKN